MEDATESLERLGLTKYEASTFAAITRLGEATASEVHEESGVPRSNVYGVLDRLAEKGLVEKAKGRPIMYRAVEPEEAMTRLKRSRREQEERALESLNDISKETTHHEGRGKIWTITGERNVVDKAREIIRASREEILVADYPGVVTRLEDELKRSDADLLLMTTADTTLPSIPFIEDLEHPVKMNGFIVLGDSEVLVSFETDEGRTGIYSDSEGLRQLFEHFFTITFQKALATEEA